MEAVRLWLVAALLALPEALDADWTAVSRAASAPVCAVWALRRDCSAAAALSPAALWLALAALALAALATAAS